MRMNIRKTIDKITTFLLILLAVGILFYYMTAFLISNALTNEEISSHLSDILNTKIQNIDTEPKWEVQKNENDAIVKLLLSTDGKLDSLLEAARISSTKAKTATVMYNRELDHSFASLDSVVLSSQISSSMAVHIVTSNEYKSSFPARVTKFNYMGDNYNVYSAGCTAEDIPAFSKEYDLSFDKKLLDKVFRIEKMQESNGDNSVRHTLSSDYTITIYHDYKLEYDVPDFYLTYYITKK